jgi:hypothetical protein
MDVMLYVGTDIATFYLYEPNALQHRAQSPWGWFSDYSEAGTDLSPLTVPERCDGRLVEIGTAIPLYIDGRDGPMWVGSDGGYAFRCTTAGLTADEVLREYPETRETSQPQLIHVTHGRLLLDGGYVLPHAAAQDRWSIEEAVERQLAAWLSLPTGSYHVVAHYLDEEDHGDEEESDQPTIILTFTRV